MQVFLLSQAAIPLQRQKEETAAEHTQLTAWSSYRDLAQSLLTQFISSANPG